jgi:YegS/Rv2252/BmrU family lipid kinase
MPAPVCLIVNPSAGGGKAGRVAPEVERALRGHGLQVRRVDTRDLDHARALAREGASAGETVVALSGDGMIGVVTDALRQVPGAVLGVLPGGRGNDLARVLGIPQNPVEACAVIAHGVVRAMDLGEVGAATGTESKGGESPEAGEGQKIDADPAVTPRQAFVGIASAGFDSDANRIANQAPAWLGNLVYAYGALRALASWRPARFEIELDPPGKRLAFTAYTVGAANSKTYGGGMQAAPGAMLDDGLLEVMVLENLGKLKFLTTILPKVFKGDHVNLPSVHVFKAAAVEISADRPFTMYADGDPIGELPVRVHALRGAVSVLVPAELPDRPAFSDPIDFSHSLAGENVAGTDGSAKHSAD